MKTFKHLREFRGREPSGKTVFDKKIKGVPVKITQEGSKHVVYIDGDRLDDYKSEREAMNMAKQFVDQYKE